MPGSVTAPSRVSTDTNRASKGAVSWRVFEPKASVPAVRSSAIGVPAGSTPLGRWPASKNSLTTVAGVGGARGTGWGVSTPSRTWIVSTLAMRHFTSGTISQASRPNTQARTASANSRAGRPLPGRGTGVNGVSAGSIHVACKVRVGRPRRPSSSSRRSCSPVCSSSSSRQARA